MRRQAIADASEFANRGKLMWQTGKLIFARPEIYLFPLHDASNGPTLQRRNRQYFLARAVMT